MLKLKRFFKDYKTQFIVGPLCKFIEAVLELFAPMVVAKIIDNGIKNADTSYILKMGGLMVLLGILGFGFALICQYSASIASQGAGTKIRNALFDHVNKLSHKELDLLGASSIITRVTNDVNQVQLAIAMFIRLATRSPFLIIGALIMAASINLKMSLIFFCASILIAVSLYFIMTKTIPFYRKIQKKLDKISLISQENLSGNRVIRAFSKQQNEKERFKKATDQFAKSAITVGKLSALLNPLTFAVTNAAILLIVWFGAKGVFNGDVLTGDIIALVNYMNQILLSMVIVANLVVLFTKAFASAERINQVFETQPSVYEKTTENIKINTDIKIPKIKFENVSFKYCDGDNELENISFEIKRGQTLGIIGGTGSGKTTLINLIPRFYDATQGTVYVDGVNVKEYSFTQLRNQMGIVPQKSVLFSQTIRENIQWGNEKATDEEIWKALEIAQAKEFVEKMPISLNSHISRGGKNLSGGQRQRLTIARAVVKKPKILILDDSASALDYATDLALRRAISENFKDTTVIIVSQRCASVKNADNILFLDDGMLIAQGSHKQLLKSCNQYKEVCLSQGEEVNENEK